MHKMLFFCCCFVFFGCGVHRGKPTVAALYVKQFYVQVAQANPTDTILIVQHPVAVENKALRIFMQQVIETPSQYQPLTGEQRFFKTGSVQCSAYNIGENWYVACLNEGKDQAAEIDISNFKLQNYKGNYYVSGVYDVPENNFATYSFSMQPAEITAPLRLYFRKEGGCLLMVAPVFE